MDPRLVKVWNDYRRDPDFQKYVHDRIEAKYGYRPGGGAPAENDPESDSETESETESEPEAVESDQNDENDVHEVQGEHGISYHLEDEEAEF